MLTQNIKILILLLSVSCKPTNIPPDKLRQILTDFSRHSYFLSVKVNINGQTQTAILENNNCYLFLHKKYAFNTQQYQEYISQRIINDQPIYTGTDSLQQYCFTIISTQQPSLGPPSQIIKKHFIKRDYFYIIKQSIDPHITAMIISQLFDAGIYCTTEDEDGMLIITASDLQAPL